MAYTVTYNGNGSDGGSVPVDSNSYTSGQTVTVLSPGSLSKTGDTFAYWSTVADGAFTGNIYGPNGTFTITGDVTLYAQWYTTAGLPKRRRSAWAVASELSWRARIQRRR